MRHTVRQHLRRAVAATALTAVLAPMTAAPASADETTCDAVVATAAVTSAEQAVSDARAAFKAANRPLGRLVAAKRHEARAELAQSKAALRALAKETRSASTRDGLEALRAEARAERRDVAEARSLLTFKRATLAAIKADRAAARTGLAAAQLSSPRPGPQPRPAAPTRRSPIAL